MSLVDELKKLSDDSISKKAEHEEKIFEEVTSHFKDIFESKKFYDDLKYACSGQNELLKKKYTSHAEVHTISYFLYTRFTVFFYDYDCKTFITSEDLRKRILITIRDMFIKQLFNLGFNVNIEERGSYKYNIEMTW